MALISLEYYLKFKWNTKETIGELKMESFRESSGKDTEWRDVGLFPTLKVIRLVSWPRREGRSTNRKDKIPTLACVGETEKNKEEEGIK